MKNQKGRFGDLYGKEYDTIVRLTCPHYDEFQDTVGDSVMEYLMEYLLSVVRIPITRPSIMNVINVLELGAGTGETTKRISPTGCPLIVFAVDKSREMLEIARSNLGMVPWIPAERVQFIQADALEYLKDVPARTVHVFASAYTLHNFDCAYRSMVLMELSRVLRHGALFVNADKYARDDVLQHEEDFQWQLALTERKFDEVKRPDLKKSTLEHFHLDNSGARLMREGESKKEMARLGFRRIRTVYREKMEATVVAIRR